MRAEEMTVGIEICNLENLRIFNGYEVVKKEAKHSGPSSPEDSACSKDGDDISRSKAKGQHSPRQKCGRPSNPIPRHKRDSHIRAEYKRRDKIQKGFETLQSLVPDLSHITSCKESKSSILFKTAEYCRGLKEDCGQNQNEAAALRRELESLGSEIHTLQEQLPDHGLKDVPEPVKDLDGLYDMYVKKETNKNWKFWIFSFFMRPLFKSYRSMMSGKMNQVEFAQATNEWVTETLSLSNLRKGFLDTFRKFSTQTSILTDPSKLEEEAHEAVSKLGKTDTVFVKPSPPSPKVKQRPLSPNINPSLPSPNVKPSPPSPNQVVPSLSTSPVPSHSPVSSSYKPVITLSSQIPDMHKISPSLVPTVVKASETMSPPATTEVPRSGRSRPSTPPSAVVKQRRRSRSRSEMNRTKIVEQSQPMDTVDHQCSHGNNAPEGSSAKILRKMLSGDEVPETNSRRYLIADTIASPTVTSHFDVDKFVSLSTTTQSPVTSADIWPQLNTTTEHDFMVTSDHTSVFTTSYNASHSSTFLPLDSNVSISNGHVMPFGQSMNHSEHQSLTLDVSMDTTMCQSTESYDLDNLSIYTTAQPNVISSQSLLSTNQNTFLPPCDESKPQKQEIFNQEEDSLTSMLNSGLDLMDVGSILTFLDQDQSSLVSSQSQQRVTSS